MTTAPATVTIPGYRAGTWKADPVHCEIAFSIRQLMVSTVRARFTSYDVTIVTSEDPLGSSVAASDRPRVGRHRQPEAGQPPPLRRLPRGRQVPDDELPLHRHPPDRRRLGHRR